MTREEFKKFLKEKPSYCKKGYNYLMKLSKLDFTTVLKITNDARAKYKPYKDIGTKKPKGVYNKEGLHIVLPCVHIPFHNKLFMTKVIDFIHQNKDKIVGLHIIGDFVDMNALSSHDKGKKALATLSEEYSEANLVLDAIEHVLPKTAIKTYIWGNHEDRFKRYMSNSDNSKLGEALLSPTDGLKLLKRGYEVFEDWKKDYITLGNYLTLSHGEFINTHSAKKHIDVYRKSVMYGHTHRVQTYIEGQTGGFNIGTMADLESEAFGYASRAMIESWNNAFGLVTIKDGYYYVEIPVFYNNHFIVGGKVY